MATIVEATKQYDAWVESQTKTIPEALETKYKEMADNTFKFFRATFYRWSRRLLEVCPEISTAPRILSVGDLHIENYGMWRDAEGRLIWGINDFDEATPLPYLNDLLRLATSLLLTKSKDTKAGADALIASLLDGYKDTLRNGGSPFLLERENPALRSLCLSATNDTKSFWEKMDRIDKNTIPLSDIPQDAINTMRDLLPSGATITSYHTRESGLGSLGRPRYVIKAQWNRGTIFREAKRLLPSSATYSQQDGSYSIHAEELLKSAVRCPDPYVHIVGDWSVRRLAPDSIRLELKDLKDASNEKELCWAMGAEAANVHLGTPTKRGAILEDMRGRTAEWIYLQAKALKEDVDAEAEGWKRYMESKKKAKN